MIFSKWLVALMIVFAVLALIGVSLGANNLMAGPVHYPGSLLATWFVVDILTILIIGVHIILYVFVTSDESDAIGLLVVADMAFLGISISFLFMKHLAWVSGITLVVLVIMIIIDMFIIAVENAKK